MLPLFAPQVPSVVAGPVAGAVDGTPRTGSWEVAAAEVALVLELAVVVTPPLLVTQPLWQPFVQCAASFPQYPAEEQHPPKGPLGSHVAPANADPQRASDRGTFGSVTGAAPVQPD